MGYGMSKILRRHRGPIRVAVVLVAFLLTFANISSSGATAFSGVSTSILGSGCTSRSSPMKWWGAYPYISGQTWPKGTVYVCWTKYRLKDNDPNGDYYAMEAVSQWTYSSGYAAGDAQMYQLISSSASSKDNVYNSTGSFTASTDCSASFSVGFSVGPFGVSTSEQLCKSYTVSRFSYGSTSMGWTSAKAGKLRTVRTTFVQKVAQGVVPKFTAEFAIPQYYNDWNGSNWVPTSHLVWTKFSGK